MKNNQKILVSLMACGAIVLPSTGNADSMRYNKKSAPSIELRNYNNYEHREPCQMYKKLPTLLNKYGTRCMGEDSEPVQPSNSALLPVISSYTIYFDFDKSDIRGDQRKIIEQLIREVNTYHPTQITVTGHTDTAGAADYNQALSAKRADAVSTTLSKYNISSFYLKEAALGEQDLAVPTPDDTKLSSNRRVVVQFRK